MKRSFLAVLGLVIICGTFVGFSRVPLSRVQGVVVTQNSTSITIPYESLGWIKVSRKAPLIQYRRIGGQLLEWGSFGYFPNLSQEAYLQGLLNKKLVMVAKRRPGVESIINTTYWPDLTAAQFPEGLIYAKGEMIRYKRVET